MTLVLDRELRREIGFPTMEIQIEIRGAERGANHTGLETLEVEDRALLLEVHPRSEGERPLLAQVPGTLAKDPLRRRALVREKVESVTVDHRRDRGRIEAERRERRRETRKALTFRGRIDHHVGHNLLIDVGCHPDLRAANTESLGFNISQVR